MTLSLESEVVCHINALRLRDKQQIVLFNNSSFDYLSTIHIINKREIEATILKKTAILNESPCELNLIVSLIANDKLELVIQKAVELGVNHIYLINTQNTQRIKSERIENRIQRLKQIIIAACEQCGRSVLPSLTGIYEFNEIVTKFEKDNKFIMSPRNGNTDKVNSQLATCSLIIGPEGGFRDEEVQLANQFGWNNLQLGTRILRAETAAIAGITTMQQRFGDFN